MAAGLKAKDLALLLGVSASYISMIEAGKKTNVNEKILTAAAEKMGVSVIFLLKGVDAHAQVSETPAAYSTPADRPTDRADASRLDEVVNRLDKMQAQIDTVLRLLGHRLK